MENKVRMKGIYDDLRVLAGLEVIRELELKFKDEPDTLEKLKKLKESYGLSPSNLIKSADEVIPISSSAVIINNNSIGGSK